MTNADVLRAIYERFSVHDIEGALEFIDPEIEWEWSRAMPDSGVYRGHQGFREGAEIFRESWGEFQMEMEELIERGDNLFAAVRYRATGRESGVRMDALVPHVWEFRGGKAVRFRIFLDVDKSRRRFLE